ncbi:meiotically up-regulated gene 113-domain-containing protein [Kalaharituber pfeilii]|nr:meiotically up-regulated gene 113-domain-containing protein [Kalaharituber pfeilii]
MPFVPGTPEALDASLQRRDSRDFNTTCRGVNQNGTPCRTKISSKVSALKTTIDGKEAYFCWRHKEQAKALVEQHAKESSNKRRGSMDVLVDKVMSMAITDKTTTVTMTTTAMPAAAPTVTVNDLGAYTSSLPTPIPQYQHAQPTYDPPPTIPQIPPPSSHQHKVISFLSGLFNRIAEARNKKRNADVSDDDDDNDPPGPAPYPPQPYGYAGQYTNQYAPPVPPPPPRPQGPLAVPLFPTPSALKKKLLQRIGLDTIPQGPPSPHMAVDGSRPANPASVALEKKASNPSPARFRRRMEAKVKKSTVKVYQFLQNHCTEIAIIPDHLSPETKKLLEETLNKEFSASDTPGYIYIFALTDKSPNRPLLPSASTIDPNSPQTQTKPRVLMKIGRTINVQSRLNQHASQCQYEPTLIRFYPHSPEDVAPHKVPNVNRIERLIHLELRDDPLIYPEELKHKCAVCNKVHQEWFSIEASDEGIRTLDELITRWIIWGEYWGSEDRHPRADGSGTGTASTPSGKKSSEGNSGSGADSSGEVPVKLNIAVHLPPEMGGEMMVSADVKAIMTNAHVTTQSKPRKRATSNAATPKKPNAVAQGKSADVSTETKRVRSPRQGASVEKAKTKTTKRESRGQKSPLAKKSTKSGGNLDDFVVSDDEAEEDDEDSEDGEYAYETAGEDEDEVDDEENDEQWVDGAVVKTTSPEWLKRKKKAQSRGKSAARAGGGKRKD